MQTSQHSMFACQDRSRPFAFRRRCQALVWLLALAGASLGRAAPPTHAANDPATRDDAIRSIPFDKLNEATRERIASVVTRPSLYRRLPIHVVDSDPDMYLFLLRNPEVMVNMWQIMDITKVALQRTGPYTFLGNDGAGTVSNIELVYGTHQLHLLIADGTYEGPLLKKKLRGRCVMLITTAYSRGPEARVNVTSRLDVFIQVDNAGADLLVKTLQPLVGQACDVNFVESLNFISQVSRAAEKNTPGVQRLAPQLTAVEPAVRTQFVNVAQLVNQRAAQRLAALGTPDRTARDVVPAIPRTQ